MLHWQAANLLKDTGMACVVAVVIHHNFSTLRKPKALTQIILDDVSAFFEKNLTDSEYHATEGEIKISFRLNPSPCTMMRLEFTVTIS
jgi:hypothetical protein